jgi:hypothetical protein
MSNIQLGSGLTRQFEGGAGSAREMRVKAMPGAMLECAVCTGQKFHQLNEANLDELRNSGAVSLLCDTCHRKTYWLYGAHGGVATPAAVKASEIMSMSSLGSSPAAKPAGEGPRLYQSERRINSDRRGIARRFARRVALQLPVRLRVNAMSGRFEEVTRTINTSKSGIYFQTEHPYSKGATAMVTMNYNPRETGMTMDQTATVVRVEHIPGSHMRGVAMQFH